MATASLLHFLRRGSASRRYRTALQASLRQEPGVHHMPALLTLPLPFDGVPSAAEALLSRGPALTLHGSAGSGRTLALLQLAYTTSRQRNGPIPVYIDLARSDVSTLTPREVLLAALEPTGQPPPLDIAHAGAHSATWLLLLDNWEALAAERRARWQRFLETLPPLWPQARLVLALPGSIPPWAEWQAVLLTSPDAVLRHAWLTTLLPAHDPQPLVAALAPGGPLMGLGQRVLDIALLAQVYPRHGLPQSRAQLYAWASRIEPLSTPTNAHLAAAQMPGWYHTARRLVERGELNDLGTLPAERRAEVALLLANMLHEPTALFCWLWAARDAQPTALLTLARCLCEQPGAHPRWSLRTLEALSAATGLRGTQYSSVLHTLLRALPTLLAALGPELPPKQIRYYTSMLTQLARLPADQLDQALVLETWLRLIDTPAAPATLRQAAGNALGRLPAALVAPRLLELPPPDALAGVIRLHMLTHGDETMRAALHEPAAQSWADSLASVALPPGERTRLAQKLLALPALPAPLHQAALTLLPPDHVAPDNDTRAALLAACVAPEATTRLAGLEMLRSYGAATALPLLSVLLLQPTTPWPTRAAVLELLGTNPQPQAGGLLARCALHPALPLAHRIAACAGLAKRPTDGTLLLQRMLRTPRVPTIIKAAAARALATQPNPAALPDIIALATSRSAPLLVRQAALEALGSLGHHAPDRTPALHALRTVLRQQAGHVPLTLSALAALATLGDADVLPLLTMLLQADLPHYVRSCWQAHAPTLAAAPVAAWPTLPLPDDAHTALTTVLTRGPTEADQPGSLDTLVHEEAQRVRQAAATTLVHLAHTHETSRLHAQQALQRALQTPQPEADLRHLLGCICQLGERAALALLAALLHEPATPLPACWLIIEHLGPLPGALPVLTSALAHTDDPFTCGRIVQALGQSHELLALPPLRELAYSPDTDHYVRLQAIAALGTLNDSGTESTLLHLLTDPNTPPDLRGAAAAALPTPLRPELRRWLYDLLRRENVPHALLTGALRLCGRLADRTALSVLLLYTQHDQPAVALAAVEALTALDDPATIPVLVRLAHTETLAPVLRLHATARLVALAGAEYVPLLRAYAQHETLALRLLAFEHLLACCPNDGDDATLLADADAPPLLRLRAAEALHARQADPTPIGALLTTADADTSLRLALVPLLAARAYPAAQAALAACAQDAAAPLRLRRRCVAGLAHHAALAHHAPSPPDDAPALAVLSTLATEAAPLAVRDWAARALLWLALPDADPAPQPGPLCAALLDALPPLAALPGAALHDVEGDERRAYTHSGGR